MECFLKCYLERFNSLPRNSLHDRRRRKCMVDYISTLIEGVKGEDSTQDTAKEAIAILISYHEEMKQTNSSVCLMGKYHNILYIAVKLCYIWQVNDQYLIASMLKQIFVCENTFERIFIGAIFGTKAPHYIAGWKSDFEDQEENFRAVVYYLDKANTAKLILDYNHSSYRFIDIPMENCGRASCLKIAVQLGLPDKLHIFLRYGAKIYDNRDDLNAIQLIMNKLLDFNHCYPYNLVSCLQVLLRVVPIIKLDSSYEDLKLRDQLEDNYIDLVNDGVLPLTRCGYVPAELKHLCRCAIRKKLMENFYLPNGIRKLPLPENLWRYIDIMED